MGYSLLRFFILYPIIWIIKTINSEKREFFKKRLTQNFAFLEGSKETIWVHCSSVGEVNLSHPLVEELLKKKQNTQILISVFTDTGYENAKNRYIKEDRVKIIYFPLDSSREIKKILNSINLKLLIIIETEIWPNLINKTSKKAKVILVNGRISDRSYPRYKKLRYFIKGSLKKISQFYMQSQEDADRIISLGAKKDSVFNVGNLKFSIKFENYSPEEREGLKKEIFAQNRKILVLGSTRELEEEKILTNIKNTENLLIVLTPRHLSRVPNIEKVIEASKLTYHKYSEISSLDKSVNLILVDKMGVLRKFYSIADVAFVGGTLVNIGGHSLLEPLFYGLTPIFGRYTQNVKEISSELLKLDLGTKIEDESEFEAEMELILKRASRKEKIRELFEKNSDVLNKIIEKIEKLN